jgi:hypothetical protein
MNWTKIFLGFNVAVWLPYGLLCFLVPETLADVAGLAATSATAATEVRAMYGGLQAAVGVLAGMALLRASLVRPALVSVAYLVAGLFAGRSIGAAIEGTASGYTMGAALFEMLTALAAATLLRSESASAE